MSMSNLPPDPNDEERVQLYHAMEDYIADLQAERRPTLPRDLPPGDRDAFQMAAQLHGAQAGASEPDPDFVVSLQAQLLARISQENAPTPPPALQEPTPIARSAPQAPRASRRSVLAAGLAAAAGIAAGVGGGILAGEKLQQHTQASHWETPLVGMAGAWLPVAKVAGFAAGSVIRFTTPTLVGHLERRADGSFVAFSAACTHMGCIVAWNGAARTFDCPCHNGRFDANGQPVASHIQYRPLPQIATRSDGDDVYVFVPTSSTTDPAPASTGTPDEGYGH